MEVAGTCGKAVSGNNKEDGSPFPASKFSPNRVEIIEFVGVPHLRTLNTIARLQSLLSKLGGVRIVHLWEGKC